MKKKKNYKKNKKNHSLETMLFENMREGVMVTDLDGVIETVNPAFTAISGFSAEESIGKKSNIIKSDRHDEKFFKEMWNSLERKGYWQGEIWNRHKSGEVFLSHLTIIALKDSEGVTINYSSMFHDITDIKQNEEIIKHQAYYDTLTELPNRFLFIDRLKEAVARARRGKLKFAILFLDLDNFKNVNDVMGHAVGDMLLKETASRLIGCVREVDTVSRLGGDEFIILMENLGKEHDAVLVSRKIINALSQPFTFKSEDAFVNSSIGISIYPDDADTVEDIMKYADMAMYHAKELGKGNYQFFTQNMNESVMRRLKIEKDLRNAINRNEMVAHYQPRVALKTGEVVGMEALMRWRRPNGALTSPGEFIPLAEETGLIVKLDEWMLQSACAFAKKLRKAHPSALPVSVNVSVNLSAVVLERKDLVDVIYEKVKNAGLKPIHVELEVTESSIIKDVDTAIKTLGSLREIGFSVSLDDFGTGYSSLSYFTRLPINILKIDRSFVIDLSSNPSARSVAKAIIKMAHDLGIRVVAEGVETKAQLDFLRLIECDEMQGYFFSKPLPPDELLKLLNEGKSLSTVKS